MKTKVLIEGIVLLFLGLVGVAEGLRLIRHTDPREVSDMLGPGYYVLFISACIMVNSFGHLLLNRREYPVKKEMTTDKKMRMRMVGMITILVIYTLLVDITGYFVASILFFLSEFRIVGIKSWRSNIILTFSITVAYYIVFVHLFNMRFPRGIVFG